ncbi:hypothetical protein D3C72_2557870 [compost metagenome]
MTINGRPAKAAADVKPGDRLEIQFGGKTLKLEILLVPSTPVAAKSASELYRLEGDVAAID